MKEPSPPCLACGSCDGHLLDCRGLKRLHEPQAPEGYEEQSCDVGSVETLSFPDGYEKAEGRRRMVQGRPRRCGNCSNVDPRFVDNICPGCLETLKVLGRLRVEIARVKPKALTMSLPDLMRALWKSYQEKSK